MEKQRGTRLSYPITIILNWHFFITRSSCRGTPLYLTIFDKKLRAIYLGRHMNAPVRRTNFVSLQKNAWPALPNSSEGVKTGNDRQERT